MDNIPTIIIAMIAIMLLSLKIIKYLINKFREYNMVKNFSGPYLIPVIGNPYFYIGELKDISHKFIKYSDIYKSPWRIWIGPKLIIIVNDPENIQILTKSSYGYEKSEFYDFLKYFLGNGLLTAPSSMWKIHREFLNPVFKEQSLKTYMVSIIKNANRFARILETLNGKETDVFHNAHLCTLDIICDGQFQIDLDLQNDPGNNYPEYILEGIFICMKRIVKFWLHPDFIFRHSSMGKKAQKYYSYLSEISDKIIRKKKESIRGDKIILESENHKDTRENISSLLDILFKLFYGNGEYSEQCIKDQIHTVLIAGSETTAITVSFVLYMLALYPEIQENVYDELYRIYGSSLAEDVTITYEDIKEMRIMERVIKETLRLFPPVPLIGRGFTEDVKVDENIIIPKNCNVIISILNLHRNEKYWKDPLTFNPDRFLPGNYDPKCFIPFSFGKRNCIGQRFAMMEIKGLIATVLRKFIVKTDNPLTIENIPFEVSLTLRSTEPKLLRFIKR